MQPHSKTGPRPAVTGMAIGPKVIAGPTLTGVYWTHASPGTEAPEARKTRQAG